MLVGDAVGDELPVLTVIFVEQEVGAEVIKAIIVGSDARSSGLSGGQFTLIDGSLFWDLGRGNILPGSTGIAGDMQFAGVRSGPEYVGVLWTFFKGEDRRVDFYSRSVVLDGAAGDSHGFGQFSG